jgi:hypothetical protein
MKGFISGLFRRQHGPENKPPAPAKQEVRPPSPSCWERPPRCILLLIKVREESHPAQRSHSLYDTETDIERHTKQSLLSFCRCQDGPPPSPVGEGPTDGPAVPSSASSQGSISEATLDDVISVRSVHTEGDGEGPVEDPLMVTARSSDPRLSSPLSITGSVPQSPSSPGEGRENPRFFYELIVLCRYECMALVMRHQVIWWGIICG